ncbi:hypothetical protein [Bacillus phage vB_BceS-M2]
MKFEDMLKDAEAEKQTLVKEIEGLQLKTKEAQASFNELAETTETIITLVEIGESIKAIGITAVENGIENFVKDTNKQDVRLRTFFNGNEERDDAFNDRLEPVLHDLNIEMNRETDSRNIAQARLNKLEKELFKKKRDLDKQGVMINLIRKASLLSQRGFKLYKVNDHAYLEAPKVPDEEVDDLPFEPATEEDVQTVGGNN